MPPPHPQCDGVAVKKHYAALEELSKPLADEQYHVFEVPLHVAHLCMGQRAQGGRRQCRHTFAVWCLCFSVAGCPSLVNKSTIFRFVPALRANAAFVSGKATSHLSAWGGGDSRNILLGLQAG